MFCAAGLLMARGAAAASFEQLYAFENGGGDAANPYAGLIIDGAGNLYGTTYGGGSEGLGAVYELSPPVAGQTAWTERVLYSFYSNRTDGVHPTGRLAFGANGVLFGTTSGAGGAHANGFGTVFALSPPATEGGAWSEATLFDFSGSATGETPYAGVISGPGGVLYGTTSAGGVSQGKKEGQGSVFSLSPPPAGGGAWSEAILHTFLADSADGESPESELLLGSGGALFGTTPSCSRKLPCAGTVYEVSPPASGGSDWTEHVLVALPASGAAGEGPSRGVISDAGGTLYGVTSLGTGTAFKLVPPATGTKWQHTVIARFGYDKAGGPQGELLLGPGGVLYGTLTYGAHKAGGTAFALTPNSSGLWPQTILYSFTSKPPGGGVFPVGNLVSDNNGNVYGVTEIGGAGGVGTVFRLTP